MEDPYLYEAEGAPAWWRWLRVPYSWRKFNTEVPGVVRPQMNELVLYGLACTLLMLAARGILHYCVLLPLGRHLKLTERRPKLPAWFVARSAVLESRLPGRRRPSPIEVAEAATASGLSERSVDNWLRVRRNMGKPTPMARFTECSWYLIFYTTFVVFGFVMQWREAYLWDSRHMWVDWPHQNMSRGIFWYYMLELGFYASSVMTLTADIRRKDYLEMTVHHLVTIGMISISWLLNFLRVGSLTLIIHDIVDPLLAFGKLAKYVGAQKVSDATFGVFLVVWVITRLIILPYRVVYSVYADCLPALQVPPCLVHYMFVAAFATLQLLHCVWTYYIFRIVIHLLRHGQTDGDNRSDSEMSDGGDSQEEPSQQLDGLSKKAN